MVLTNITNAILFAICPINGRGTFPSLQQNITYGCLIGVLNLPVKIYAPAAFCPRAALLNHVSFESDLPNIVPLFGYDIMNL